MQRIEASIPTLAESEAKVARWILSHPSEVLNYTVRQLAHASDSSQAAVTRLSHSLQIKGYNTLKVLLTADVVRHEGHVSAVHFSEIQPDTPFSDIVQVFEQRAIASVRGTLRNISEEHLEMARQWIVGAERILVYGVGASAVVAQDFHQKLIRLGLAAFRAEDFHMTATSAGQFQPHDLVVVVSHSGETSEVLEIAEIARRRHVQLIALTRFAPRNPLAEISPLTFYISAEEPLQRISATYSVLASLVIVDTIVLYLANKHAELVYARLQDSRQAVLGHRRNRNELAESEDTASSRTEGL